MTIITMNNNLITETDLINAKLNIEAPSTKSAVLKDLIEQHYTVDMLDGEKYYKNNSDIQEKKQYYYSNGVKFEDTTKTNNKISNNWHKILVDQKVSYMVGKPIVITSENKVVNEIIQNVLSDEFDDTVQELAIESSNKGLAWLQFYIDEEGSLKHQQIPAEEIIPIWDTRNQLQLSEVIRYYTVVYGEKSYVHAEWWNANEVEYYTQTDAGTYVLDPEKENNPEAHYMKNDSPQGWGRVPFVCFKNNSFCTSDLTQYKNLVDAYDNIISNTANDFDELQKAVWVLKGYQSESMTEFLENLRYYKTICLSRDGELDTRKLEIPMEAIDKYIQKLEDNIFVFGQGVNPNNKQVSGNTSGVALKFLFSLLDLKCEISKRKFKKSIRKCIWFVFEYYMQTKKTKFDYKEPKITFTPNMIMNQTDLITDIATSVGIVSQETLLAMHPFVEDVEFEKKQIELERDPMAKIYAEKENSPNAETSDNQK